jgi:nitroreductase
MRHPGRVHLDDLDDLVRRRRTHMLVDAGREVPVELVERLCTLATWAPNHKKTWPWRFALFTGSGRDRLGEAFVADMVDADFGDEGKRQKTRAKYTRTPAVLVVGSAADPKPTLDAENRDAVAAGVQNLLLGATAAGLASFWSTPPMPRGRQALGLCGFEPDATIVAVVYLGWPNGTVEVPARPAPRLLHVDGPGM